MAIIKMLIYNLYQQLLKISIKSILKMIPIHMDIKVGLPSKSKIIHLKINHLLFIFVILNDFFLDSQKEPKYTQGKKKNKKTNGNKM